jgi:putative Holliday junction resolvase
MPKGKILAIDYGTASIGLAVSDSDRQMAFGRGVLKNKAKNEVFNKISELVKNEPVELVLIGLPMGKSGEETPQTAGIRRFKEELAQFMQLKGLKPVIEFADESFTTYEANEMLKKLGVEPRNRKSTEDEMSAIILIHRYIDFRP